MKIYGQRHESMHTAQRSSAAWRLKRLGMGILLPGTAWATTDPAGPAALPGEFVLFGLMLLGIAFFSRHALRTALVGLVCLVVFKCMFTGFRTGPGLVGLLVQISQEWVTLANLFCLLTGFAVLARHFEKSHLPTILPRHLYNDWRGGFMLLVMVFTVSTFLDNIAAALIGGTMARQLFRNRVHLGYLTAIVGAANAGGAGSVVGDTTTTMMWTAGVSPLAVFYAYVGAILAFPIYAIPAALQQQRYSPIETQVPQGVFVDWTSVSIVLVILVTTITTNVYVSAAYHAISGRFPFVGLAIWAAILFSAGFRKPDWCVLPSTARSAVFLLSLVGAAALMPVEKLPAPDWLTTLGLGFFSAIFDNVPLTALALKQGRYDWGILAYAVGFGGSITWFGSSAGVALSNLYPESRSVAQWLRQGWYVTLAYVLGFAALLATVGWHPSPIAPSAETPSVETANPISDR